MPLFYFDIQFEDDEHRDGYGDAFDTIEEAASQARALLFDVVRDHPLREGGMAACEVRDDQGHVRYRAEITYRSESTYR